MIRRIFNILWIAAVVFFAALVILAVPSFFAPEFEILNNASAPVSVTAGWRDRERQCGGIEPGAFCRFSVSDEGAMKFTVRYADEREIATRPVYFTRGIKVLVTVSDDRVELRYDEES